MKAGKAILLACILLLGGNTAGISQDFNRGIEAYEQGDFETALRELKPLAEQGNEGAQFYLGVMFDRGKGVVQDYK